LESRTANASDLRNNIGDKATSSLPRVLRRAILASFSQLLTRRCRPPATTRRLDNWDEQIRL
jgi:hypothetical protein